MRTKVELLDIGGEGRHENAWNLNPRSLKTLGRNKGVAIPRHILGRAERIPLPDRSVQQIIMERTPLRRAAVLEMIRVVVPGGTIILRHYADSRRNPHVMAQQLIDADFLVQQIKIGRQELQQTRFMNVGQAGVTRSHRTRSCSPTFLVDYSVQTGIVKSPKCFSEFIELFKCDLGRFDELHCELCSRLDFRESAML